MSYYTNSSNSIHFPILIYGVRIDEFNVKYYLENKIDEKNHLDYSSWNLQQLANKYQIPLLIARREYHDGETNNIDTIVTNCPLYIALHYSENEIIDIEKIKDVEKVKKVSRENIKSLLNVFRIQNYEIKFYQDICDMDMRFVQFTPNTNI